MRVRVLLKQLLTVQAGMSMKCMMKAAKKKSNIGVMIVQAAPLRRIPSYTKWRKRGSR